MRNSFDVKSDAATNLHPSNNSYIPQQVSYKDSHDVAWYAATLHSLLYLA